MRNDRNGNELTRHTQYNWEVERLGLKPEDVKSRLSYHKSITTTIDREGIVETVRFRRGDKIWSESQMLRVAS